MAVNGVWAVTAPGSYMYIHDRRGGGSQSRWAGNPSEARWRRQLLTTLTHNRYLEEAPGLTTYAVYCRRSHKMKQSQNTRVVSGGRRGGSVLAGERKGSGCHSGEWRGSAVLTGAREKATAVACTWAAPGQRKTPEPLLSRSMQLPSAGLGGRPRYTR